VGSLVNIYFPMQSASGSPAVGSMALMFAPVVAGGRRRRSPCCMVLATSLAFATLLGVALLPVERSTLFVTAGGLATRFTQKPHDSGKRDLTISRAGEFSFGVAESEDYTDLFMEEQDNGAIRLSSQPTKFMESVWNTVLGDTVLPDTGRHYWEVTVVKKPTDNFEFIGVAEQSADVTVPLNKNKKGGVWSWASSWSESRHWIPAEITWEKPEGIDKRRMRLEEIAGSKTVGTWQSAQMAANGVKGTELPFDFNKNPTKLRKVDGISDPPAKFSGPVGTVPLTAFPAFDQGTVVGVDVDMDQGTLGFWADGKYLGIVRDMTGKPVNLKGKKVVPAVSIFGHSAGETKYHSVMEVKSGLQAPQKP